VIAKLCSGPSHAEPTWVVLHPDYWNFYLSGHRAGKPLHHCKACRAWERMLAAQNSPHRLVARPEVLPWIEELIRRCDTVVGVERRHGIPVSTLWPLASGHRLSMQRRTAARILSALAEQRKTDRRNGATSDDYRSKRIAVAVREKKMMEGYAP
jgi:hypothetical protein